MRPASLSQRSAYKVGLLSLVCVVCCTVEQLCWRIAELQLALIQEQCPSARIALLLYRTVTQDDTVVLRINPEVYGKVIKEVVNISQVNTAATVAVKSWPGFGV